MFILLWDLLSKKFFLSLFLLIFLTSRTFGFEMPTSEAVEVDVVDSYKNISGRILCVDVDKVFNSHPKTQKYKKEIKDFAKTRKTVIEERVKEFSSIAEQVKSINLKLSEAKVLKDEKLIGELSKQFEDVQSLLREQKLKIADLSERTKNEIALMEEKNTSDVLKDIENLIKKISKKYNADIVLDKHSVLTGKCKDITDEVIKMVKDM